MVEVFRVGSGGELAPILSEGLEGLKASLMWHKDSDLDLIILYKTKEGNTGSVSSDNIGSSQESPYIVHEGGGVEEDETVSYEKVFLKDLSNYTDVYFVATNFSDLALKRPINFNEYKGVLKVSSIFSHLDKKRYLLDISSEEQGDYLVLGKIEVGSDVLMLKNLNQVMTSEEFREKIPGAENIII